MVGRSLPSPARKMIARATEARFARRAARRDRHDRRERARPRPPTGMHKALAAASGAAGGAFGLAAVAIELPVSTTIMLRSIAQIAREEGEDLTQPEAALACIEVFALGGRAPGDAALDSSYFAIRSVLAKTVSESARFILQRGLADETAPGSGAPRRADRRALRRGGQPETRRPGDSGDRRFWRRGGQSRLRRTFPDHRARPFHGAPAWSAPMAPRPSVSNTSGCATRHSALHRSMLLAARVHAHVKAAPCLRLSDFATKGLRTRRPSSGGKIDDLMLLVAGGARGAANAWTRRPAGSDDSAIAGSTACRRRR